MANNSRQKRTPKQSKNNKNNKLKVSQQISENQHDDDDDDYEYDDHHHNGNTTSVIHLDHDNNHDDNLSDEYTITGDSETLDSVMDITNDNVDNDVILMGKGTNHNMDASEMAAIARLQKLRDTLVLLDEYPSEKRSAKREYMLRKLYRAMKLYATGSGGQQMILETSESIRTACLYSIRIGIPSEQYVACRVIEATSVLLGDETSDWLESIEKYLRRTIDASPITPIRCAALRALCVTVCMNSPHSSHDTEHYMDLCEELGQVSYRNLVVPLSLRATAMDCWSLLASTIDDDKYIAGRDEEQIGKGLMLLPLLQELLENQDSMNLRSAAGQCLALIHEARLNYSNELVEQQQQHDQQQHVPPTGKHHAKYQRGSWQDSEYEDTVEEMKIRIHELSNTTGHYMTKHDKKEQRKTFREYMATICHDESPEEILYFSNGISLTLSSWKEIIQLEFIRHCLQGGLQIQLLTNHALQRMFSFTPGGGPNTDTTMSSIEKRLYLSKTSAVAKHSDIKLKKERKKRHNIKNHFLTADDE